MRQSHGRTAGPSRGAGWQRSQRRRGQHQRTRRGRTQGNAVLVAVVLLAALTAQRAAAQSFDQDRYYQQCLRFEAGGSLETAKQSCLNALQVAPDFVDAELALARIELKLGELSDAESRLQGLVDRTESAEPLVLLAQAAYQAGRIDDAEAFLPPARKRLAEHPNRDLSGALNLVEGEVAQRRGRTKEAGEAFQRAVDADGLNATYRLADARLRFLLGDLAGARDQLNAYMQASGDTTNAAVRSLLGRVLWSGSDLDGAASQIETALALRSSRQTEQQASDLRDLSIIYYAQGDLQAGGLALREAARRGNLQGFLFSNTLLWVVLFLVLVATHLVAESRIPNTSTLEVIEGPQNWSVGQVYGILIASILVAALVALLYSQLVYANVLAFLTPLQDANVRAVFLLVLTLFLVGLAWRRVARNGWDPTVRLLGVGDQAVLGLGMGIVLLAATLAYLRYAPVGGILGPYYLNLTRLTPLVVAAVVLLPLTELFFRAFLIPALQRRYDPATAGFASASVYALALVTPIPLLFVIGLVLTEVFRRRQNGVTPLIAQMVVGVGLVLLVAFSDWPRSLFLR